MTRFTLTGTMLVLLSVSTALHAAPIVYPAKGQTPEQQSKDDGECYVWAKQNTGIDPATAAQHPVTPQEGNSGKTVFSSTAIGTLGGAAIGAIAGDAGKGAGIGALLGIMAGGRKARREEQERLQQATQQQENNINTYYRAYSACMTGRGYTVN